jgi:hypothetical protein
MEDSAFVYTPMPKIYVSKINPLQLLSTISKSKIVAVIYVSYIIMQ